MTNYVTKSGRINPDCLQRWVGPELAVPVNDESYQMLLAHMKRHVRNPTDARVTNAACKVAHTATEAMLTAFNTVAPGQDPNFRGGNVDQMLANIASSEAAGLTTQRENGYYRVVREISRVKAS